MTACDRAGPVAIVAGSGQLPMLLAEALEGRGRPVRLLAIRGFAERAARRRADATVDLLDVKGTLGTLEAWAPSGVALAGGVQRPGLSAVLGAFSAYRNRRELSAILAKGDDALLRAVLGLLEEKGHRLLGIGELAPELLASSGRLGRLDPAPEDERAITCGLALLRTFSPFDIGQAAIVAGERVLAVEGPEGTDRMLARVERLRRAWPWSTAGGGGALVKAAKRGQDARVDLPVIGPRTIRRARQAGLTSVAVGAGDTLILNHDETVAMADRLGIALVGRAAGSSGP